MTISVKICGLMRPEDIEASIAAGASYLGFIVEAASPRRLSVSEAARLTRPAAGITPRVAVTVNASDDLLRSIMAEMAPDYIQCHGDENPERVAEIGRVHNVKTIKAIAVSADGDMVRAESYSGVADLILYDAKPPKGSKVRGGHGVTIDWDIIKRAPTPKGFMLAGGLNPDNAALSAKRTGASILDISSGVELSAGVKDPAKIKAFFDAL
ncbi:MAG: phosphoribosylanthranilate isomerase [Maricaulaceae bacterium]